MLEMMNIKQTGELGTINNNLVFIKVLKHLINGLWPLL